MFYAFVKLFFAPLVRIYLRLRVRGRERVPAQGPAIVVANHASFLDPIVLGSACPRKIHFIVLQAMYDWWRLRWFYWGMQTIPVRADEGDPRAIRLALWRLKRGHVVGLFPEGARSGDGVMREGKMGVALLAALSGAPVIPCFIQGAFESLPPGVRFPRPARVSVSFGEAVTFQRGEGAKRDRADLERFSSRLLAEIVRLKEEAGEGLPSRHRERAASPRISGNP
ncbi:MAG: 1-acyl-sn-glycerol-3-phosphate acyltransferase [Acidobacteria bacterium]|nr:1-acyl-sn-glycerol-3-phosphate acyltransferase [Acidobacteriota bacterium]